MLCWPRLCPGAGLGAAATGAGAGTAACDRGRRAAVWDVGTDCGMFVLGGGGCDPVFLPFLERSNSSEAAPLLDDVELPSLPAGRKYYPPTEETGTLRPELQ